MAHMTSLTRYEGDGLEFYITKAGEVFATNGGIARMCDVGQSTLRMWMGGQKYTALKHKIYIEQQVKGGQTAMVKQTVSLYNEDAITSALEHFSPERLRVWAQIGIRAMAHKLTGWALAEIFLIDGKSLTKKQELDIKMAIHNGLFGKGDKKTWAELAHLDERSKAKSCGDRLRQIKVEMFFGERSLDTVLNVLERYNPIGNIDGQLVVATSQIVNTVVEKFGLTLQNRVRSTQYQVEYGEKKTTVNIPSLENLNDWAVFLEDIDDAEIRIGIPQ